MHDRFFQLLREIHIIDLKDNSTKCIRIRQFLPHTQKKSKSNQINYLFYN